VTKRTTLTPVESTNPSSLFAAFFGSFRDRGPGTPAGGARSAAVAHTPAPIAQGPTPPGFAHTRETTKRTTLTPLPSTNASPHSSYSSGTFLASSSEPNPTRTRTPNAPATEVQLPPPSPPTRNAQPPATANASPGASEELPHPSGLSTTHEPASLSTTDPAMGTPRQPRAAAGFSLPHEFGAPDLRSSDTETSASVEKLHDPGAPQVSFRPHSEIQNGPVAPLHPAEPRGPPPRG
jgi:hypothetical protein